MSASASNIRVFVRWKDSTVFAGEDIECTITFRNVAPPQPCDTLPSSLSSSPPPPPTRHHDRQRKLPPVHSSTRPTISRNSSFVSAQPPPQIARSHRPALSLHSPSAVGERRPPLTPGATLAANNSSSEQRRHGRSLSIISLATNATTDGNHERGIPIRRPPRGHARSASLQVVPGRPNSYPVASPGHRSATHPSPLSGSSPPPDFTFPSRSGRRRPAITTTPSTPALPTTRKPSNSFSHNFKFPAAPPPDEPLLEPPSRSPTKPVVPPRQSPRLQHEGRRNPTTSTALETLSPVARIISGSSMHGTPRSSGEFYSMSNNSNETLVSEYTAHPSARLLPRPSHQRSPSHLAPPPQQTRPESLMMGYAQIMGSFTLDGSLINQAPFEEVKRKGVVGGQGGGGVVGVEKTKRESGLFGALGWGNIGESLGGLLGSSEPSSIREMRGIASSKTVPLISTPQSILFVDLKLAPGESRSYTYSFTIPRGLPPTHKGRSMKVAYNLTIGTQRAGSTKDQQVRHVDIPFRVFGSVNSRGEILGHDLMSPYIILRDQARTKTLDPATHTKSPSLVKKTSTSAKPDENTFSDFLQYVENLLDRPRQNTNMGLLSPTGTIPGRSSMSEEPQTMKEAIDTAILRSNLTGAANQSANRFEIARSGKRVAVIMLARPSYRLGETMSAVIDFTNSHIPCYSIHVSLESSEKVDPAIALRSNASIYRATKKVHASFSERALFARKLAFSPTIPPNATPDFITSGVSLEWKLRVEFITPRLVHESGEEADWDDLLEEISRDDRGVILAAAQRLPAESFEVQVPIRVYGAVSGVAEEMDEEGLPV
ncbi:hypothetical protein J1614_004554 [Plenodomus biglobosus]|nr:hypothetical protein J1614_004554 [Plenodomus biglobosus]